MPYGVNRNCYYVIARPTHLRPTYLRHDNDAAAHIANWRWTADRREAMQFDPAHVALANTLAANYPAAAVKCYDRS